MSSYLTNPSTNIFLIQLIGFSVIAYAALKKKDYSTAFIMFFGGLALFFDLGRFIPQDYFYNPVLICVIMIVLLATVKPIELFYKNYKKR